jgi:acetoin utilization protein AcuB
MTEPTIDRFMTLAPHTIGQDQTLATARRTMMELSIRHLPVLEDGKHVGILSLRDLDFLETLKDVDPETVKVSEAMTQETFAIGPKSSVRKVAAEMATNKYGCAVIVNKQHIIGIFTTVDALNALATLLDQQHYTPSQSPSVV